MTNNRIPRTVRMGILSMLLALVAFSFLAVGGASAHSASHASSTAQNLKSCPSNVVHIVPVKVGQFIESDLSCHAITVKVGVPVVFFNPFNNEHFVENFALNILIRIAPGPGSTVVQQQSTQPGQVQISLYGSHDPTTKGSLTITIVQ